jgi:hypothetical protein
MVVLREMEMLNPACPAQAGMPRVFFVIVGVAGFGEACIALMVAEHFSCMLDRAKILFGAGDDCAAIGDQPGAVGAIRAVEFFDDVQVSEMLAVENDVIGALHLANPVDRKTAGLVKTDAQVDQQQRKRHAVDDWAGQQVLRAVGEQPIRQAAPGLAVFCAHRACEFDPLAVDLKAHLALLFPQGDGQLFFKLIHFGQQSANFVAHHGSEFGQGNYQCDALSHTTS